MLKKSVFDACTDEESEKEDENCKRYFHNYQS